MDALTKTETALLRYWAGLQNGSLPANAPWPIRSQHTERATAGLLRKDYVVEGTGEFAHVVTDQARDVLAALAESEKYWSGSVSSQLARKEL